MMYQAGGAGVGMVLAAIATNKHYDLPVEVFQAFLDSQLKYTCGLYRTGQESLEEAQTDKLRFITRLLHLGDGDRVLDIGCGWGSLTLHLAAAHRCHVTAVTPSTVQTDYLRSRVAANGLGDLVDIRNQSIYDVDLGDERFDAVALVGVIEHLPDHEAVLALSARHLRRRGRLYVSASCYRNGAALAEFGDRPRSRHVTDGVFGYGVLRPLSALTAAVEDSGLSMSAVVDLTAHYQRTVGDWVQRVRANRDRIEAAVPGTTDELLRYFDTTQAGWGYTTKHYALTAIRSRLGEMEMPV